MGICSRDAAETTGLTALNSCSPQEDRGAAALLRWWNRNTEDSARKLEPGPPGGPEGRTHCPGPAPGLCKGKTLFFVPLGESSQREDLNMPRGEMGSARRGRWVYWDTLCPLWVWPGGQGRSMVSRWGLSVGAARPQPRTALAAADPGSGCFHMEQAGEVVSSTSGRLSPEASGASVCRPCHPWNFGGFNMCNGHRNGSSFQISAYHRMRAAAVHLDHAWGCPVCSSTHRPRPLMSAGLHLMSDFGLK